MSKKEDTEVKEYAKPIKYKWDETDVDVFSVSNTKNSDDGGRVTEGLVYRWGNVSKGREIRAEKLKRKYWEKCTDPDVEAPQAFRDEEGVPTIEMYGERYKLFCRPVEAERSQFEWQNKKFDLRLKQAHNFPETENIKGFWKLEPEKRMDSSGRVPRSMR